MYVHRLAFDPDAVARCSPGLVNTLDDDRGGGRGGLTRVEFLGGGERYKLELADGLSPLYHGFGLGSGVRGRAYAAAHLATIRTRLRLKRSPRLHRLYFEDLAPARRARCSAASSANRSRFRDAVRGEAAAGDEARDRPEAALGGEADEQQVRVARAEVAVEHRPAVATATASAHRRREEREPVEPEAEARRRPRPRRPRAASRR